MRRTILVLVVIAVAASSVGCRKLFRRHRYYSSYDAGSWTTSYTAPTTTYATPSTYHAGPRTPPTPTPAFLSHQTACDEGRGAMRECNLLGIDFEEGRGTSVDY